VAARAATLPHRNDDRTRWINASSGSNDRPDRRADP